MAPSTSHLSERRETLTGCIMMNTCTCIPWEMLKILSITFTLALK